ncbi:UDP-3-O-[3-hydroxymyristoyl] N-acetylglucosamine deacetylase [bacterium]|nr:UDP-3-O-[3-hydroxymyristoyl] N-acetylglucosamine deacetylase [candidate division CSSED10-310 bacterium]
MNHAAVAMQRTIAGPLTIPGVGLFTCKKTEVTFLPAPTQHGIVFEIRGERGESLRIPANTAYAASPHQCTVLGSEGFSVMTIEHLMAALYGLGITNLLVCARSPEIPHLDGCSQTFVDQFLKIGLVDQDTAAPVLAVDRRLTIEAANGSAVLTPHHCLEITYRIDFQYQVLKTQEYTFSFTTEAFIEEIASARTFNFANNLTEILERRRPTGGDFNTVVVFDEQGPMRTTLRFEDEPVRHKILDALGDLALLGKRLHAAVRIERGSHSLHLEMVRVLQRMSDSDHGGSTRA